MKTFESPDRIGSQIALRESFEVSFGVCAHDEYAGPLSLVEAHPAEDYSTGSSYENHVLRYIDHGIKDKFGLSLNDFLDLPRDEARKLFRISAKANELEKIRKDKIKGSPPNV